MKRLLNPAILPWLTPAAGALGLMLRIWLYSTGIDETGLLIAGHPAEILIWLLTAGMMVLLWLSTTPLVAAPKYRFNFPRSLLGAAGCGFAALGIGFTSAMEIMAHSDTLTSLTALVGILAAASLAALALMRFKGIQPGILFHVILCVYFMLRLVSLYRHWSADPQLQDYFFPLLATVFFMLTAYHRAAFDVDWGRRRPLAFCQLAAVYFSCLSLTGENSLLFYLPIGAWIMTNLCSFAPLPSQTEEDD